jgi:hypothetical protein
MYLLPMEFAGRCSCTGFRLSTLLVTLEHVHPSSVKMCSPGDIESEKPQDAPSSTEHTMDTSEKRGDTPSPRI